MAMPLEGVRVIDLTVWLQGPYGTAILADMGAEVIKVEEFPRGDPARGIQFDATNVFPSCNINYLVELQSRGKKSIAIDLRKPEARGVMHRLAKESDVFVSNLRRQALEKWGLDYATLSQVNPRLVYARASGYGPKGPDADQPAMDVAAQARGGMLSVIGEPENPPPAMGIPAYADCVGAMQLALGISLALLARQHTGLGQEVNTSLLGGQMMVGAVELQGALFSGKNPLRTSRKNPSNPLRSSYQTGDGRWISFNLTQADRYWPAFCRALELEDILHDPRFNTMEARKENAPELVSLLDQVFATRNCEEWMKRLREAQLLCSPVNTYAEVAQDPQVLANEYVITVDHPVYGPVKEVGIPIQLSRTPGQVRAPAPQFGQHTEEVLLDVAGLNWEEIGELKERGVIL